MIATINQKPPSGLPPATGAARLCSPLPPKFQLTQTNYKQVKLAKTRELESTEFQVGHSLIVKWK